MRFVMSVIVKGRNSMPRFEVTTKTVYEFDAVDKEDAKWCAEYGYIPSVDRDPVRVFVSDVARIVTDEDRYDFCKTKGLDHV